MELGIMLLGIMCLLPPSLEANLCCVESVPNTRQRPGQAASASDRL
jgi:hypothetical protein